MEQVKSKISRKQTNFLDISLYNLSCILKLISMLLLIIVVIIILGMYILHFMIKNDFLNGVKKESFYKEEELLLFKMFINLMVFLTMLILNIDILIPLLKSYKRMLRYNKFNLAYLVLLDFVIIFVSYNYFHVKVNLFGHDIYIMCFSLVISITSLAMIFLIITILIVYKIVRSIKKHNNILI